MGRYNIHRSSNKNPNMKERSEKTYLNGIYVAEIINNIEIEFVPYPNLAEIFFRMASARAIAGHARLAHSDLPSISFIVAAASAASSSPDSSESSDTEELPDLLRYNITGTAKATKPTKNNTGNNRGTPFTSSLSDNVFINSISPKTACN